MEFDELFEIIKEHISFRELVNIMTWASVWIDETKGATFLNIKPHRDCQYLYEKYLQSSLGQYKQPDTLESFYLDDGIFVVILKDDKDDEMF